MKRSLVAAGWIASLALASSAAVAQPNAMPAAAKVSATGEAPTQLAAAKLKSVQPVAALTVVSAAGSLIVLADGIVANAAIAVIQPPAEGFVYER